MASLRVHQHGVNDVRVALPFPPLSFRPARQIGRVAALEHDAFDRVGILAGAGARRDRRARRVKLVPAVEGNRSATDRCADRRALSTNASSRARRSANGSSRRSLSPSPSRS